MSCFLCKIIIVGGGVSPKTRSVILLVDTSHPESYGHYFYQSFVYHQEKPSNTFIKKLLLRSVLYCAPTDADVDTTDLDSKLSVSRQTVNVSKLFMLTPLSLYIYVYCKIHNRVIVSYFFLS